MAHYELWERRLNSEVLFIYLLTDVVVDSATGADTVNDLFPRRE